MEYYKEIFNKAGWFIPSYVTLGYIQIIAKELREAESPNIEKHLQRIYSKVNLAAMVTERYIEVPYINEYKEIISESIEAHFLGLEHVAVAGLMPVVEGVGMKLVELWEVERKYQNGKPKGIIPLFADLASKCKDYVIEHNMGMVSEIVPALDAFEYFLKHNFYVNSNKYEHSDKTNRHGILHGAYKDNDYGEPINFYKTIGAIEFLSFIISLREDISFFAPSPTKKSQKMAALYDICSCYKGAKEQL